MKASLRNKQWLWWAAAILPLAGLGAAAWFLIPALQKPSAPVVDYWPTNGWRSSTPEEQGFDSVKLAEGLQVLKKGKSGIHSLLIIRNGRVLLDAYFAPYDGSFPHKLASVTKSVTTTLVGIAADQGKLQLDQPMVSFFPDRTIANLDDRKKSITVRHLMEMMNGMESGCLSGDEPTLNAMRSQPDWVQAALDRKMVQDPGSDFCYDSPGMHLLSAILQKATGMTESEFAQQNLFGPLGIHEVFWQPDPQGYTHGWGDLYLKPLDAAKIGYLWLNQGQWEDKQIVSASWVADAVKAHSNAGEDDYGYGIWVAQSEPPNDSFFAAGRGGQYIRVYPSYNAIVVATGWGLSYDEIDGVLGPAFQGPDKALVANPDGVDQLTAMMPALLRAPQVYPTGTVPDAAKAISGKTFVIAPNAASVATLLFEFGGAPEATLYIVKNEGGNETWLIGLDGHYRQSASGEVIRGYWADPQTFVIEVFEDIFSTYEFHFEGNGVKVNSPELGLKVDGQVGQP
jgi:CubicO group peptidase (beta-lactamase class C family)